MMNYTGGASRKGGIDLLICEPITINQSVNQSFLRVSFMYFFLVFYSFLFFSTRYPISVPRCNVMA